MGTSGREERDLGRLKGRTSAGRLRALDVYLLLRERALLAGAHPILDVGLGQRPFTTLELLRVAQSENPRARIVGLERSPEHAAAARAVAGPGLQVLEGGFEAAGSTGERYGLVRAMNVLRAYPEAEVAGADRQLGACLIDGGLYVEGTSDRAGDVLTARLLRRTGGCLLPEGLLLWTSFARGFAPLLFRDHLPRTLRRGVRPGQPIHAFLGRWTELWELARARGARTPRASFTASARALLAEGSCVSDTSLLESGYVIWRPVE